MGIAKEVTGLRLALYVIEFLAQHQVGLVEGNSLSELTAARVTIACACAKSVCYIKQTLVDFLIEHEVGLGGLSDNCLRMRKESLLCTNISRERKTQDEFLD